MLAIATLLADVAEEGRNIVLSMLVVGLIFIAVIVLFRGGLSGMVESAADLLFRRNRHGRPA